MKKPNPLLPLPTLTALLIALAAIAAPHALWLPFWVTALVLTCGAWAYLAARRGDALPPAWLRTLLTVAVSAGIFASFGTLLGRDAGTALLMAMTGLKLLEMRRRRDTHIVMYLGFFLIATHFLFSQSLPAILYLALAVWAMTMLLISVHQAGGHPRPWQYAGLSASLVLQAVPVMLVLFVLFPRIAGPLWQMPEDAHGGSTGLSESMSPGSINNLSRSDAVAFRVKFEDAVPNRQQLYWRGPVLESYDGGTWSRAPMEELTAQAAFAGGAVRYSVLLEPHNQRWLFALDLPQAAPGGARLNGAYELQARSPVHEVLRYEAASHPRFRLQAQLAAPMQARYLHLPAGAHPRATELARRWRAQSGTPLEVIDHAIAFFRSRPFVYTLTPPLLRQDPVDQFLFETQRGFCEHYAGAFAVLMRAAGIPARVVTGYQGGELNGLGDYMIVRQSDAHAWTEIWLADQGWVRFDPTGLVAPERIERGLDAAVPAGDPVPFMARLDGGLLKGLRLRWDALDNGWNTWVLGYGPQLQAQVMQRVGLDGWQQMVAALAAALGVTVAVVAIMVLRGGRPAPADPWRASYDRFCQKLARGGLRRQGHEGPRDFAARVVAQRPDLADQVNAITGLYIRMRYAERGSADELRRLRQLVRAFRA